MSRGFRDIKKQGGQSEITRQTSYDYLIKVEKVADDHNEKAKERFKAKPYSRKG